MLIKSLHLENIRSYADENIEFPEGSVLLSGDIGAGKSTVLLSIEFALFGIKKPGLSGGALLRKGSKRGSVELKMLIDGKNVIIKRTLHMQKNDVRQDSGSIIIDGVETKATPIELKSIVLNLLGYPKALLRKQKEIIFRYTVYTPQEEMKAILFEDSEGRLNTLRKAFGLDKYRRIRENCLVYTKKLKDRKKYLSGQIVDLTEKKQTLSKTIDELKKTNEDFEVMRPGLIDVKNRIGNYKKKIDIINEQIKQGQLAQKKYELFTVRLQALAKERRNNTILIEQIKKECGELNITEKIMDYSGFLSFLHEVLNEHETNIQKLSKSLNEFELMLRNSSELKNKIISLSKCPLCEQEVSADYKKNIVKREEETQKSLTGKRDRLEKDMKKANEELSLLKSDYEEIKKMQSEQELMKYKIKNLLEKNKQMGVLENRNIELKKEIGQINQDKIQLRNELPTKDIEEKHNMLQDEMNKLLAAEREAELENARLENQMDSYAKNISMFLVEIQEKEKIKLTIHDISKLQIWLEDFFINLSSVIEKHILSKLYGEFNERFVSTFDTLMADENISVRLNDEFTPIIQQNGYDIELNHLSGGEKTSVALSYRIALNYVINDLVSQIKTKDIIILDEPTDGFSDDQFDRVRDVLDKLKIKQIIIVSHESKIESFVDNVINIKKNVNLSIIS